MKTKRINPKDAEITLLTKEQAEKLPSEILKKDDFWWLRSPSGSYFATLVSHDGWAYYSHIVHGTRYGVVPAFQINNLKAEFGDKVYVGKLLCTVVGDNLVLSDKIVCKHRYDKKSSNWETSELKAFIESDEFAEMNILDEPATPKAKEGESVDADTTTLNVNLENLNKDEREALLKLIEKANRNRKLSEVPVGETFKAAGIEFIHFGDGVSVTKDVLFDTTFDKDTNDFSDSELLAKLEAGILYDIEETIGANNVLSFKTDLLALDGTSRGMYVESKISIPTLDFYRANREIFDKYCIDKCWWLATPNSTNDSYVCCVNRVGSLHRSYCGYDYGVRPFLIFKSDILVS